MPVDFLKGREQEKVKNKTKTITEHSEINTC